RTCIPIPLVMC
uniref:Tigerinin-2O n=1 Tax=Hoplobatrachus occipitalis TaxID=127645 RepID=TIN2O_HOPOC|nr:RecName: Full=Tigerinin-2O [Hoplobatrachus occipitalis]